MAKVLSVDDSDVVRSQVKKALEDGGYEVVEAENGVRGIEMVKTNPDIKLIICDVNMPEMDGLTMCAQVRKMDGFGATPIFMLTTESGSDMKEKGKAAGVTAWMVKPFNPDKMVAAAQKVIK